ncbi:MAG: DUF917 family protein [Candidatus Nanohaloarchaea archaeon]|nr:DUF917 family protein [Candidatus Nanohaloarchaea archaeon]
MNLAGDTIGDIWSGIAVLAGGGGGHPGAARRDLATAVSLPVDVTALSGLPDDATVVTAFGVGSVGTGEDERRDALRHALDAFQDRCGISPDAVMPVEVGAGTVAGAAIAADVLDVPLVDADHVGLRCAPDIQCETITLAGLDRTPLVAATAAETETISAAEDPADIEDRLRDLASERTWYVLGYPLTAAQLRDAVETGWTGRAYRIGRALRRGTLDGIDGVTVLARGRLATVDLQEADGFTVGRIRVAADGRYDVYVKNENIFVERDGDRVATAPATITLIDTEQGEAVYNGAPPAVGTPVTLLEIAPAPLWDTAAGRELFAPEALGFAVEPDAVRYKDITRWER